MSTQGFAGHGTIIAPIPLPLDELDELQAILEPPEPQSGRGQQIRRLEELGFYKSADGVSACGRLGEKSTYECDRSFVRKILRANLRFCCARCDKHIAGRLFEAHRAYRERLHPSGTLYEIQVESNAFSLSSNDIRDFENNVVESVRRKFQGSEDWGYKGYTHYVSGRLIIRGIIYIPPGEIWIPDDLSVLAATCLVSTGMSVSAFELLLANVLRPTVTDGPGIVRADLMAAFHGGNHLRSIGIFYGLISRKRETRDHEKLDLSSTPAVSGAALIKSKGSARWDAPYCPHCGPRCRQVSSSIEPLSGLGGIPSTNEIDSDERAWMEMKRLFPLKPMD
jgi:hypothetical protein